MPYLSRDNQFCVSMNNEMYRGNKDYENLKKLEIIKITNFEQTIDNLLLQSQKLSEHYYALSEDSMFYTLKFNNLEKSIEIDFLIGDFDCITDYKPAHNEKTYFTKENLLEMSKIEIMGDMIDLLQITSLKETYLKQLYKKIVWEN